VRFVLCVRVGVQSHQYLVRHHHPQKQQEQEVGT
jgi:hypothetical protein